MRVALFLFLLLWLIKADGHDDHADGHDDHAHHHVECGWTEDTVECEETESCCPLNMEEEKWGCCAVHTFCLVSGTGQGSCCDHLEGDEESMNMTSCHSVREYVEAEDTYSSSDIAKAFMMTMIAGACTAVGVVIVFFIDSSDADGEYDTTILGYSLAVAAGVMLYISLTRIFLEAVETFGKVYEDNTALARFVSFLTLMVGMFCGLGIDFLVNILGGEHGHSHGEHVINDTADIEDLKDSKSLRKVSLITALAVALHNLPEGLITFVASVYDPDTGAAIALAIAAHNIPEGIAIAVPIYYDTGNICQAFFWSLLSGISEPIGALLGYAILDYALERAVFAWLFGMTAGVMTYISIAELLPVAQQSNAQYTTQAFFFGMFLMELSFILFELAADD